MSKGHRRATCLPQLRELTDPRLEDLAADTSAPKKRRRAVSVSADILTAEESWVTARREFLIRACAHNASAGSKSLVASDGDGRTVR